MRAFEIYSGVGGMGMGFEAAGIEVSGGVDAWDRVGYVRAANGMEYHWADASDLTEFGTQLDRNKVDIVIGGPPCQDFSKGGKRRPGQNAAFTRSYALLIATARPQWFVYENVTEAAESREYFDARKIWIDAGYGLTELFLDASRYGVPQERWRLITIGRRGEAYQFLEAPIRKLASKEQRTVRSILDPRDPDDARLLDIGYYYTRAFDKGPGVFGLDEPANGVNKSFRQKPYGKHKTRENPKDAIRATQAHVLTQQQTARLQGFPRNFRWPISRGKLALGDVDQMVANAMPPAFAYYIAKAIRERHEGKVSKVNREFGEHLLETRKDLNERTIDNICGRVNRARGLLGGRTYRDPYLEVAALERMFDDIERAWRENEELPADKRQKGLQKSFDTTTKSDMRVALRMYAERPRAESEVEVAIAKGEVKRKKERKRPSLFPRYPSKWEAKWTIEDLLHSPMPTRVTKKRLLTPRVPPKTVEEAYLADKSAQDFDPYPQDDYRLSPPALDPDENWRPEGYDDPMQETDYLAHLKSLKKRAKRTKRD